MNKLTAELLHQLKSAAQEEIMCREASDTSDAWQDLASPENILLLVEIALPVLERIETVESGLEGALKLHRLRTAEEGHSQLSDGFRAGARWAARYTTLPQPSTTPQIDNDGRGE